VDHLSQAVLVYWLLTDEMPLLDHRMMRLEPASTFVLLLGEEMLKERPSAISK
jgi:hypothetical protein